MEHIAELRVKYDEYMEEYTTGNADKHRLTFYEYCNLVQQMRIGQSKVDELTQFNESLFNINSSLKEISAAVSSRDYR